MATIEQQLTQLQVDKQTLVDNLVTKGIAASNNETFTNLVPKILEISTTPTELAERDINFYDYDGTVLYAYSLNEFENLTELPPLPTHEGLTCQGWNWKLNDIKSEQKPTNVGALFITDDGSTRLYISLTNTSLLKHYLRFKQSEINSFEIDWGDGSNNNICPSEIVELEHIYPSVGEYIIKIIPLKPTATLNFMSDNLGILSRSLIGDYNLYSDNRIGTIKKVELGSNINAISNYAFRYQANLKSINIPRGISTIGSYVFNETRSLEAIVLPTNLGVINSGTGGAAVKRVSLPNGVKTINSAAFSGSYKLQSITIPNSVKTIETNVLNYIYSCEFISLSKSAIDLTKLSLNSFTKVKKFDFSHFENIPTISTAQFPLFEYLTIVVPDNLYEEWINTTNWSKFADYIIKESDYINA